MKKRTTLYLKNETHKSAKKRIADLEISFSEYIEKIVTIELSRHFLTPIVKKSSDGE